MHWAIEHLDRWWVAAAIATAALLLAAAEADGDAGRTVFYQVTYDDGTSRDLSAVPDTNRHIRRVLRVTRVEGGAKGMEILSTGPDALTMVSRGQTYRTDLSWNGKAWVAPPEGPAAVVIVEPRVAGGAAAPAAPAAQAELLRLRGEVLDLAARLLASHEALAAAQSKLPSGGEVSSAVAAARKEIRSCVAQLVAGAKKLSPAGGAAGKPPAASGEVKALAAPPAGKAAGIATPIRSVAALRHRAQVWKLPDADGRRTVRVSIAHPEAGATGAFYYIAYTDTDADGRPDRLIARSPLAAARRAGQWTQWDFTTDQRRVFVGKAWPRGDTAHYHAEKVRIDDGWRGLSTQTYVSATAWGSPFVRGGPACGNIRVWTASP